jgi:Kef-type K+ transport system membrane component KefB
MTPFELSVRFFLQLAFILVVCRIVSGVAQKFGQPPVVGEMIAGIIIGPSLFGLIWTEGQAWLFPPASKGILFSGAQIGLVLYMFTVGLEFRLDLIQARWRAAAAISFAGIAAPFAFGCAIALLLMKSGGYFAPSIPASAAMPYLGAAMALTAFPMLARIISERKLSNTAEGTLALASGAIDDASAWCVLALVLAGLSGRPIQAVWAVAGGVGFVVGLRLVQPLLRRLTSVRLGDEAGHRSAFGTVLVLLMLSAWFTDMIGLYAVFGAFFLGSALPRGPFVDYLRSTIEPLTSKFFLPLFFIYSGLNTRFDLFSSFSVWGIVLLVLVAAIAGKAGACYAAARFSGENHRVALGIGMLMNARGLMELIILNIGLERGVILPALFSVFVLMAIVTTLMATPLFNLVQRRPQPVADSSLVSP